MSSRNRTRRGQPAGGALFDRFVVVDWSARNSPSTGADSIWIAELGPHDVELSNPSTRWAAIERLNAVLDRFSDRRVLLGVDVSLGYPGGTARLLGLTGTPWEAMWGLIADLIEDDERNRNNRFEVAAELNRRIGDESGPFWGCPAAWAGQHLHPTKPAAFAVDEFRSTERRLQEAGLHPASNWQLLGVGSVGSQTLTLLAVLAQLRARRHGRFEVWPFTTALNSPDIDVGEVVVAEVWPTMFPVGSPGGVVADEAQVGATVLAVQAADGADELSAWFAPRMCRADRERVVAEEGWILGRSEPTHLR